MSIEQNNPLGQDLRYAAESVGVKSEGIFWDDNYQKVTMVKGDKVIQLQVGSNNMVINGINVIMDASPMIINGRVVL